ncbi:MAG: hypothetical protein ABUS54_05145 [Actinomycetota bacterium]
MAAVPAKEGMHTTRVPSSLRLVALVAAGGLAFGVWGWYHPSSFRYTQRNHTAFQTVPVYPSGHFVRETTSPQYSGGSGLSRVLGYTTTREYELSTAIPAEALIDYYLYELRGCRLLEHSDTLVHFNCTKLGDVAVSIDGPVSSQHYRISVDSQ